MMRIGTWAHSAGPELDILVAEHVMGWTMVEIQDMEQPAQPEKYWQRKQDGVYSYVRCEDWHPSAEMRYAWVVRERVAELQQANVLTKTIIFDGPSFVPMIAREGDWVLSASIVSSGARQVFGGLAPFLICLGALWLWDFVEDGTLKPV